MWSEQVTTNFITLFKAMNTLYQLSLMKQIFLYVIYSYLKSQIKSHLRQIIPFVYR